MQIPIEYGHMNAARGERPLAAHRNAGLELVYVENGYVTWDYEGETVHVPPGHVSFSWPWERHGAFDGRLSLVELYWIILPLQSGMTPVREPFLHGTLSPLSEALRHCHVLSRLRELEVPVLKVGPIFKRAFVQAIRSLDESRGMITLQACGWMCLVVSDLCGAMKRLEDTGQDADQERCQQFFDMLESRLGEPWTLERLAGECGMGRTRFTTCVKQVTGDTPLRTLNRLRVAEATRRLQQADQTISEIAYALGFGSSQYFATVYKRITGKTPSAAR